MSKLFTEFDSVSLKKWKQKIQYDLKGADYNETLVWSSPESIDVKPVYHNDDFDKPFGIIPGQPSQWNIAQHVFIDDAGIANSLALDALSRGADAIVFSAEKEFDLQQVFKGFNFDNLKIYFQLDFLDEGFIQSLIDFLFKQDALVYYNIDPIARLASEGNWFHNLKADHVILENIINNNPNQVILGVDLSLYQNAGANIVQQLAYAMSHTNEYLNHFHRLSSEEVPAQLSLCFKVAVGGNYFFEIAKLRALRKLYASLASEYGLREECHILTVPTHRNKTLYDYNVNMLRTTTESMSAILGGANTICNLPYDALYHKSNEFGERISRNQLLILKAESYFDMVSNPADGSYYIEKLTKELSEKALNLFKSLEKSGGFLKLLKEGTIQKKIKESANKEQELFDSGKLKLIGSNVFQNKTDRMKNDLELFPFVKTKVRKTLLAPIVPNRLSEEIEKQRLANED